MEAVLKAEFKKLLTVRSTYLLALLIIILSGFFTYVGTSKSVDFSNCPPPAANTTTPPACPPPKISNKLPKDKVVTNIEETVSGATVLIAIAVILLMAHEYRYN